MIQHTCLTQAILPKVNASLLASKPIQQAHQYQPIEKIGQFAIKKSTAQIPTEVNIFPNINKITSKNPSLIKRIANTQFGGWFFSPNSSKMAPKLTTPTPTSPPPPPPGKVVFTPIGTKRLMDSGKIQQPLHYKVAGVLVPPHQTDIPKTPPDFPELPKSIPNENWSRRLETNNNTPSGYDEYVFDTINPISIEYFPLDKPQTVVQRMQKASIDGKSNNTEVSVYMYDVAGPGEPSPKLTAKQINNEIDNLKANKLSLLDGNLEPAGLSDDPNEEIQWSTRTAVLHGDDVPLASRIYTKKIPLQPSAEHSRKRGWFF